MNSFNVYYKNNNASFNKTHLKAYLPTLFHPHQIPTLYLLLILQVNISRLQQKKTMISTKRQKESYMASSVALLNRLRESIPPLATQIDQQQLDDNLNSELFIELVRQYPCIWNVRLNVYRDQSKKKVAWDENKECTPNLHSLNRFVVFWKNKCQNSIQNCINFNSKFLRLAGCSDKIYNINFFYLAWC